MDSNTPTPTPLANPLVVATGNSYNSAQLITMSCHALANVVFTAPDPKPAWFDDLNTKLQAAQALANQWLDTLGTEVTSAIPLMVLNYGPQFQSTTKAILQIVSENPNASGKDNPFVQEVAALISQTLLPQMTTIYSSVDATATTLQTWGASIQTAHNDLVTGAVNIQSLETSLSADIDKMNTAIANLHTMINAENTQIAYAAAAVGLGIFALIAGIALAIATFGAGAVIAVAGGAAIIGGAVAWGVIQAKINSQFNEIAQDQQELAQDQRQIVALQGLSLASNQAISNLETASSALSALRTEWGVLEGELQGVMTKLDEAEDALSTIVQGVFTQAAITEWDLAMQTAQSLAAGGLPTHDKTLPMDGQSLAA